MREVLQELLESFDAIVPDVKDEYDPLEIEATLFVVPHVQRFSIEILDHWKREKAKMDLGRVANVLERSAVVAQMGKRFLMEESIRSVKAAIEKIHLGEDNFNLVPSMSKMAECQMRLKKYSEALELYEACTFIHQKNEVPKKDSICLDILSKKGKVFDTLCDYSSASECFQTILNLCPNVEKDPSRMNILISAHENLGHVAVKENDKQKAVENFSMAVKKQIQANGKFHSSTAATLDLFSNAYKAFEDYKMAIATSRRALEIRQGIYSYHPCIAFTLNTIGMLHNSNGQPAKALSICLESLEMFERIHQYESVGHDNIARLLNNIGLVHATSGEYDLAIDFYKQSLEMKEAVHGGTLHTDIAKTRHNLGDAFRNKKDFENAKKSYEEAVKIYSRLYGSRAHSTIATLVSNLGVISKDEGDFDLAQEYLQEALNLKIEIHMTRKNLDVTGTLINLGELELCRGKYAIAESYFMEALTIRIELSGKDAVKTLAVQWKIGTAALAQGNFDQALETYTHVLDVRRSLYPENHRAIAMCLDGLAESRLKMKQFQEAKNLLNESHAIQKEWNCPDRDIAETLAKLGNVSYVEGSYVEALSWYQKSLFTDESDSISTILRLCRMGDIKMATRENQIAISYYQKALAQHKSEHKTFANPAGITILNGLAHSAFDPLEWYLKLVQIPPESILASQEDRCEWFRECYRLQEKRKLLIEASESFVEYFALTGEVYGESSQEMRTAIQKRKDLGALIKAKADESSKEAYYESILKLYELEGNVLTTECLAALGELSQSYNPKKAFSHFKEALSDLERLKISRSSDLGIQILTGYAESIHLVQGGEDIALKFAEEAFDCCQKVYNDRKHHLSVKSEAILAKLADILADKARLPSDTELKNKVLELYVKLYGKTNKASLPFNEEAAEQCAAKKDYVGAMKLYKECLEVARKHYGSAEVQKYCEKLASICVKTNHDLGALEYSGEAWEKLSKAQPSSPQLKEMAKTIQPIASRVYETGVKAEQEGKHKIALENYTATLSVNKILHGGNGNNLETAFQLSAVGRMQYELKNESDAKPNLSEALRMLKAAGDKSENTRREIATCNLILGPLIERAGNVDTATQMYNEGMDILIAISPARNSMQTLFEAGAKHLTRIGQAQMERGDKAKSAGELDTALNLYRQAYGTLVKANGTTDAHQVGICIGKIGLFLKGGQLPYSLTRPLEQANFEQALKRYQELALIQGSLKEDSTATQQTIKEIEGEMKWSCCSSSKKASKVYPETI